MPLPGLGSTTCVTQWFGRRTVAAIKYCLATFLNPLIASLTLASDVVQTSSQKGLEVCGSQVLRELGEGPGLEAGDGIFGQPQPLGDLLR